MRLMRKCCFCLNLRQGTFASGIWSMVISLLALALFVAEIIGVINDRGSAISSDPVIIYIHIGFFSAWCLVAVILFFGINKQNKWLFLPWLIVTGIMVVYAAYIVISKIPYIDLVFKYPLNAFIFILAILVFLINVYAIVCVAFYFVQLGRSDQVDHPEKYYSQSEGSFDQGYQMTTVVYGERATGPPGYSSKHHHHHSSHRVAGPQTFHASGPQTFHAAGPQSFHAAGPQTGPHSGNRV